MALPAARTLVKDHASEESIKHRPTKVNGYAGVRADRQHGNVIWLFSLRVDDTKKRIGIKLCIINTRN